MPQIAFTSHLRSVGPTEPAHYDGATVGEVLAAVGRLYPKLCAYLLDDQGRVRKHIAIFIDGTLCPRDGVLAQPIAQTSDIYVFQALSGG